MVNIKLIYTFVLLSLVGIVDSIYLTTKHYNASYICSVNGCEEVLASSYATIFNIPVAILGIIFYSIILLAAITYISQRNKFSLRILTIIPVLGFLFSLWLVYLQLFIIQSICTYCMVSATTSTLLFILSLILTKKIKDTIKGAL